MRSYKKNSQKDLGWIAVGTLLTALGIASIFPTSREAIRKFVDERLVPKTEYAKDNMYDLANSQFRAEEYGTAKNIVSQLYNKLKNNQIEPGQEITELQRLLEQTNPKYKREFVVEYCKQAVTELTGEASAYASPILITLVQYSITQAEANNLE